MISSVSGAPVYPEEGLLNEEFGTHDVVCFNANAAPAESESDRVPLDLSLVKFVCSLCKKRFAEMANPPSQVDMFVKGGRTATSRRHPKIERR